MNTIPNTELNALATLVKSCVERETGHKLGFSKAKELAAKLSGLRNSNCVGSPAESSEDTPRAVRRFLMASVDGPDYDIMLESIRPMTAAELFTVQMELTDWLDAYNFLSESDLEEDGITMHDRLLGPGVTTFGEFIKTHGPRVFGVKFVSPDVSMVWDSNNHLPPITRTRVYSIVDKFSRRIAEG